MNADPDFVMALDHLARGLAPQIEGIGEGAARDLIESRLFASTGPARLGRFELVRMLGFGGMGVVYLARDPELDRSVALKVLRPSVEQTTLEALRKEAAGLARLSHPNVVTVYEIGTGGGRLFLVMEYVAGTSLDVHCAELVRTMGSDRRRYLHAVLNVFISAGRGLAAIHRAGLIHRDFKPGNVLVGGDGRPRVTDFGLAHVLGDTGGESTTRSGTLPYMALEQLRGGALDVRTDVFGFCASLYPIVAGVPAYPVTSPRLRQQAIEAGNIAAPVSQRLPSRLDAALRRGLAADPADRWPSMDALVSELESISRPRRYRGPLMLGIGFATAAMVLTSGDDGDPCARSGDEMRGVWTEQSRTEIRKAFLATSRPYARAAADATQASLDEYATRWTSMSRASCRATLVHGTQSTDMMDRRSLCLARRLEALRSTAKIFTEADASVVRDAGQIVDGLPPLPRCADVERLVAEPERPAEVRQAHEVLDAAGALWRAARFDEAERLLASITDVVETWPEVRSRARLLESRMSFAMGRWDDAHVDLSAALLAAAEAGDDAMIAEIHIAFLYQHGHRGATAALIEGQALAARASLVRAGSPPLLSNVLEASHAIALAKLGKLGEAVRAGLAAHASAVEHDLGPRHEGLALLNLAQIYRQQAAFDQASASLERARELLRSSLGTGHPTVLVIDNTEGNIAFERGDYAAARRAFTRALEGLDAELGRDHPRAMATRARLASALEAQERWPEAIVLQREVVEHARRTHGEDSPLHADALANLGIMLNASGNVAGGVEVSSRALTLYEAARGNDHIDVAWTRINLAAALSDQGDIGGARAHLLLALPQLVELLGEKDTMVAQVHDGLAATYLEEDALDSAAEHLAQATQIYAEHPGRRGIEAIEHALLEGDLALARGQGAQAARSYGRARDLATEAIGPESVRAQRARTGLRRALAASGE